MISPLPSNYEWLNKEAAPLHLVEALKYYGLHEGIGSADNPTILQWAKEINAAVGGWYDHDDKAWCALFISTCLKHTNNVVLPGFDAVRALSFAHYGQEGKGELGDVLIFSREGGGHVGLYAGEDDECYHVLGGNQGDKVCIERITKDRCTAVRSVVYGLFGKPSNVRKITLMAAGTISTNEA